MMKVKIEIAKIKCSRTTIEIGKDEIFYVLMVFAGKLKNGDFIPSSSTPVFAKLSEVKEKVSKGIAWRPAVNDFVFTVDDDVETLGVTLALYEKDKGDVYEMLQNQVDRIETAKSFDWENTIEEAKNLILKDINNNGELDFTDIQTALSTKPELNPKVIGSYLFQLAKRIGKFFSQDDLLGIANDSLAIHHKSFDVERKYHFSKFRGKYDLNLKATKV